MVQGKTKGLTNKASSSRHASKAAANTKKGQRHIAPKKPLLMKQASMKRVLVVFSKGQVLTAMLQDLTAKINKSIETQMVSAASSGKLTIMKHVAPEGLVFYLIKMMVALLNLSVDLNSSSKGKPKPKPKP